MDKIRFSLVVPVYNEEKAISKKIENCLALNYRKVYYEVIVVDDFSTDNTTNIAKRYAAKYKIIRFIKNRFSKGKVGCVNTALKAAKYEHVAITDADVMLKKDILRKAAKYIARKEIGAICGIQNLVSKNKSSAFMVEDIYRRIYTKLRLLESKLDSAPVFHGQFMVVKKSIVKKIGNFFDDTDIAIKIRKLDYKAKYIKGCIFYEKALKSLNDLRAQKQRRGTGLILVLWNNKDVLFNPRYGFYGLLIYPFEFLLYTLQPLFFIFVLTGIFIVLIFIKPLYSLVYLLAVLLLYVLLPFFRSYTFGNISLLGSIYNLIFNTKKAKDIYTHCNWTSNRIS